MAASNVSFETNGGTLVVRIQGEIDLSNAGAVRASIVGSVSNQELGVVVDLTEVSYLDSAGIRMLFQLSRGLQEHRQELVAVVPRGSLVRRSLEVGGVLGSVTVIENLSDLENADHG